MNHPVCILTAGQGRRMGPFADVINKSLLPYQGKAIISHIIDGFTATTPFVIAVGYKAKQVEDYIRAAHPQLNVTFVTVENYNEPGSGPGHSLDCCRAHLQQPFYFIAADTVASFDTMSGNGDSWAGVSPIPAADAARFCNFTTHENGFIDKIYDKQVPPDTDPVSAFIGLMFIKDYELFWQSLSNPEIVAGEVQISAGLKALVDAGLLKARTCGWLDFGAYDDYHEHAIKPQPYDFSKTDEFIYFSGDRVIKFFANADIAQKRVEKAKLRPDIFPAPELYGPQFYAYDRISGDTVYNQLTPALFEKLLAWLNDTVWQVPDSYEANIFARGCEVFYQDKTMERLARFQQKHPDFSEPQTINGVPVRPMQELLGKVNFGGLSIGLPRFIHGDLQFDNIIYDGTKFTLIDWRQEFAGRTDYGDWYYDLAKLLGGIYLNYDYIKLGLMSVQHDDTVLDFDFARRAQTFAYQEILRLYVLKMGLDWTRIQTITGLIYLNMAPLHVAPFDKLLYGLAQQILTEVLT